MKAATSYFTVSTNALVKRINRVLLKDDEILRKSRGMQAYLDCGDYYVIDIQTGGLAHRAVDLEALGRELGVLRKGERLEDDR